MAKNSMVLYGKNSVLERLKANPGSIKKIMLQDGFNTPQIEELIKNSNIPVEYLPFREMDKIKQTKKFQGIIAKVGKFEYTPYEDLLETTIEQQQSILFLDKINDPQNLGVIIRTAACFGGFAIVIPKHQACEVNETVLHVASGGENYISIALVSNLSQAVRTAKDRGYWILGAVVDDDAEDLNKTSLPFPIALILGSEGEGIHCGLLKHIDIKARIPMEGASLSFNVNMAGAIFCNEIVRQRQANHTRTGQ